MKYSASLISCLVCSLCSLASVNAQQNATAKAEPEFTSADFDRSILAETEKAFAAVKRFEAKRMDFEGLVIAKRLVPERVLSMLVMSCGMGNTWEFRFMDAHARFEATKKLPNDVMRFHIEAALALPRYAADREQEIRSFWNAIEANKGTLSADNLKKVTELAAATWEEFKTVVSSSDSVTNLILTQEFDQRKERLFNAASTAPYDNLIERAQKGDVDAQYELGKMYITDPSGTRNPTDEAIQWLRRSAEHGHTKAQYVLGLAYILGRNVPKQSTEALKWFRLAAAQGLADAQFSLGIMYATGDGIPIDNAEAVKWYRVASEQGHANAQFHLGLAHYYGYGVPQDTGEAVKWYRLASEQGNADAQVKLGVAYADGSGGVEKNLTEAVQWWERAAVQGNADAQYNFGMSYIYGEPEKQNGTEGFAWIIVASNSGHELAVKQRPILERSFGSNVTLAALERSKQILNEIKTSKR